MDGYKKEYHDVYIRTRVLKATGMCKERCVEENPIRNDCENMTFWSSMPVLCYDTCSVIGY
jgi:hypothetical protein